MKTIRFIERPDMTYGCDTPGNQAGEYVRAEVAKGLLAACEQALAICEDRQAGSYDDIMLAMRAAIAAARGE